MSRFLLALVFGVTIAQTTAQADQAVRGWHFQKAGDAEGWRPLHDISSFTVAEGKLQLLTTGQDAYIGIYGLNLPTEQITTLRIRMRSDLPGTTDVFFATDLVPNYSTRTPASFHVLGDNRWHTYEFTLRGLEGWQGKLTHFRLDPANPAAGAHVEIDLIELLHADTRILLESFAPNRVSARTGETISVQLRVRNSGGAPDHTPTATLTASPPIQIGDPATQPLNGVEKPESVTLKWRVTPKVEGLYSLSSSIRSDNDKVLWNGTTLLSVTGGPPQPPTAVHRNEVVLQNNTVTLRLPQTNGGIGRAEIWVRDNKGYRLLGVCQPLARLAVRNAEGLSEQKDLVFSRTEQTKNTLVLTASQPLAGQVWQTQVSLTLRGDRVDWIAQASASQGGQLLHFASPVVLVGEGSFGAHKRGALFPGVEYLGRDEPSSSSQAVGQQFHLRCAPPPHWITVPLMAVDHDAGFLALMWNPHQRWGAKEELPAAAFASPNFLDGQQNHLLTLFAPSTTEWTLPNNRLASQPYEVAAGGKVRLETTLVARPKSSDLSDAIVTWYEIHRIPEPPPLPHSFVQARDLCMISYRDTLYEPGAKGWTTHWGLSETPFRHGGFINELFSFAKRTGDARWLAPTGLNLQQRLIDQLGFLESSYNPALPPQIRTQQNNGTWPYTIDANKQREVENYSHGEHHDLGVPGTTCVGICASQAEPLLNRALIWGEPEVTGAALKALEAMRRFDVPAGSQIWEVNKDIPDVLAAAQAVNCFRLGYELTGDPRYLEEAIRWARRGLPFHYSWQVPKPTENPMVFISAIRGRNFPMESRPAANFFTDPKREITPYASIPVFGTSFYAGSWFGNVVQWCGLAWAKSVYALSPYQRDPLLETVARGVLISGLQQQFDKPPYAGIYPDSWHLDVNAAYPAFISPTLIRDCLQMALNEETYLGLHTQVVRHRNMRLHVSSRGPLKNPYFDGTSLWFTTEYLRGEPFECVVAQSPPPKEVRAEGIVIPMVGDLAKAEFGYRYRADRRHLYLRWIGTGAPQAIKIMLAP